MTDQKKTESAAHIKEDANKSLPETKEVTRTANVLGAKATAGVPPSVVQEDNIPSNDHGQADPRNNERSEFDESKAQQVGANLEAAAGAPATSEPGTVQYTSHPIANYRVGRKYRFDKGVLTLKGDEVDEFENVLTDMPEIERRKVRRLDVKGAEKISREFQQKLGSGATKNYDSTIGERGEKAKIGKTDLADPAAKGGAFE